MAKPFLNYTETPPNFQKFKRHPNNSNLMKSFWAILLTVFIYISVFYAFNLSPSTLLCTTKFWFIISNTLILIIATDFTSFSSTKDHEISFYQCNIKDNVVVVPADHNTTSVPSTTFEFLNLGLIHEKYCIQKPPRELDVDDHLIQERPHEKIISIVAAHDDDDRSKNPESFEKYKKPQFFVENRKDDDQAQNQNEKIEKIVKKRRRPKKRQVKCARSNSDTAIMMAAENKEENNNNNNMFLRRTLSERYDDDVERLEENEFSRMSDEELNRRVEEFIRSFNKQMRLQAAMSRQNYNY